MVKQFTKRIIVLNIMFALTMTIYRIIFTFYYSYSGCNEFIEYILDFIKVLILGGIYDVTILLCINVPIILFFVFFWLIGNQKLFIKFVQSLKYYFTISFGLIVTIFCIDFIFYFYFHNHVNCLIFVLFENEISYLWYISKNEHIMFFLLLFIILFICYLTFFISKSVLEKNIKKLNNILIIKKILICFFTITFNLVIIYSGIHAYDKYLLDENIFSDFFIKNITHPVFEIFNTLYEHKQKINFIKSVGYDGKIEQAFSDYLDINISLINKNNPEKSLLKITKRNEAIEEIFPNVILIVAESLGMNLMQYNNDEFNILGDLKKHFDEDVVFYNCLYSYKQTDRSIEQIMTTIFRMPDYINPRWSFITSFLEHNYGIDIYKNNGYKLIGENLDNDCGDMVMFDENNDDFLYDEDILDDIFEILDKDDGKKKFIFALTKTNHEPFDIPQDYNITNYKIPNNIDMYAIKKINAYHYSCQKLGEFLTRLKKSKYASNTIVAITGDHCLRGINIKDYLTLSSVPLYLYIPEKLKPKRELIDTSRIVSHIDIMPTLYELSLSNITYYSLGTSIFDKNYQNAISVNYDDVIIANKNDMCIYDVDSSKIKSYKIIKEKNKLAKYEKIEQTEKHKKMIKQYKAAMAISQYMLYKSISGSIKNLGN